LDLQTQLYKIVTIATQNKEKSMNKVTIKCQITIGTTNSLCVRGDVNAVFTEKGTILQSNSQYNMAATGYCAE